MRANLRYKFNIGSSKYQYRKQASIPYTITKGKISSLKIFILGISNLNQIKQVVILINFIINRLSILIQKQTIIEFKKQKMNKTGFRSNKYKSKQVTTNNNFYRRPNYSPVRSLKSFDESSSKLQQLISKYYSISATNWCIYNSNSNHSIGVRDDHQRQVASLTKIMTTIIGIQLFQRYHMEKGTFFSDLEILIRVSSASSSLTGTSADLKYGKYIRLYDLFYGAMLPSGNDAAFLIAQIFGLLLFYQSVKPESKDYSQIESIDLTCYESTATFITRFLKEMNKKAKQLNMIKTSFNNPHGLANILNVSSAKDIMNLCRYCYKNAMFREIVNKEEFKTKIYEEDMITVNQTKIWNNTNKLLSFGWQGIKTGHTSPAGACLASVKQGIFIVVLNCLNRQARFQDTAMLWQWYNNSKQ